MFVTNDPNNAT